MKQKFNPSSANQAFTERNTLQRRHSYYQGKYRMEQQLIWLLLLLLCWYLV